MDLTSVAPAPSYVDRFRAAWSGEESLAWVFWSYFVLVGLCMALIHVAVLYVLVSISGGEFTQFSGTSIGQAYTQLIDVLRLGYFGVAFILFVRCISNVKWRGWQYAAMLYLLGIAYQVVEQARDIGAAFLGG